MSTAEGSSPAADRIEALIEGQVSGQVAVGKYILQVGPIYGGVVNIAPPGMDASSRVQPRARPVRHLPRPPGHFLDRETEVQALHSLLAHSSSVDLYGREGVGKTALLRYLSHHISSPSLSFPDGIVHLSARHLPLNDFLHNLLFAFYESEGIVSFTRTQIKTLLQDVCALVIVDDVSWEREDVQGLLDIMPRSVFIIAGATRHVWGDMEPYPLEGLPVEAGLTLLQQGLGRSLTEEEKPVARALVDALKGHPLSILQIAAQVAEGRLSLIKALAQVQSEQATPERGAVQAVMSSLTEAERRILLALTALGGVPIGEEQLALATGVSNAGRLVDELVAQQLVQACSPRYVLPPGFLVVLRDLYPLTKWQESLVQVYVHWAQTNANNVMLLRDHIDALMACARWLVEHARWEILVSLVRVLDRVLPLVGRWQDWAQSLEWALDAATRLGDRGVEAWALHQLGTRALCWGELKDARALLEDALRIRDAIGDADGALVTRHNLNMLAPPPPPPTQGSSPSPAPEGPLFGMAKVFIGLVVVLTVAGMILAAISGGGDEKEVTKKPGALEVSPPPITRLRPTHTPTFWAAPEVSVAFADGCERAYVPGEVSEVLVKANVGGVVRIWLVAESETVAASTDREVLVREVKVMPGQPEAFMWTFDMSPGVYALRAVLKDEFGDAAAESYCLFAVSEPPAGLKEGTVTPTPTEPPPMPDLVVSEATLMDAPRWDQDKNVRIPLYVVVRNMGGGDAGIFKISLSAAALPDFQAAQPVPYTVEGEESVWYPFTDKPLLPGRPAAFRGEVVVPTPSGKYIFLWVIVDSCVGEEFAPEGCRVLEEDEENNIFGPIEVPVP